MSLSKYEQETHINYNEAEGTAQVYTASPVDMRKLDKFVDGENTEWTLVDTQYLNGKVISKTYECPKRLVRRFQERTPHPNITQEQREALSNRMKSLRQKQLKEKESGLDDA